MIEVVVGKNQYLVNETRDGIIKEINVRENIEDISFFKVDTKNYDFSKILESIFTISMFGDKKIVCIQFLDEIDKNSEEVVEKIVKTVTTDVYIILCMPKKPAVKTAVGKAISKHAKVTALKEAVAGDVRGMIVSRIKSSNLSMTQEAITVLAECVGTDMTRCEKELDKLELVDGTINESIVLTLVSKNIEEDIFAISNAILDRNINRTFSIYHNLLAQKMDPLALLGLIGSSIRRLYHVNLLNENGLSASVIADRLSMSDKQVWYLTKQPQSSRRLIGYLNMLSEIDQNVKLGKIDQFVAFELFVIEATQ